MNCLASLRSGEVQNDRETILGHKIAGVKGVYDRHSYAAEKAAALESLAKLIDRIVNPPEGNVIPMAEPRQKRRKQ
jgi:vacuolar-type H+-ATPase subunit F/Vma7